MTWTREALARAHAARDLTEFERRRRQRMDERAARARVYRFSGSTVIAFPQRPPAPPKDAA